MSEAVSYIYLYIYMLYYVACIFRNKRISKKFAKGHIKRRMLQNYVRCIYWSKIFAKSKFNYKRGKYTSS